MNCSPYGHEIRVDTLLCEECGERLERADIADFGYIRGPGEGAIGAALVPSLVPFFVPPISQRQKPFTGS